DGYPEYPLYGGVQEESSNVIVDWDKPFDPLRVKGALGRGGKKRKSTSAEGDDGDDTFMTLALFERIEAEIAAMRELLRGLPRPPSHSRPSASRPSTRQSSGTAATYSGEMQEAIAALAQAYVELREDLERERRRRRSRDKLI
ncbi:hypothetical protein HAX54_046872, partial [Datura stramonium]|nr:hypothetical protein [Datura stramonium]